MISWQSCFSEPFESAWCVVQKLAWLAASDTLTALSAVTGRVVRASPSLEVRGFTDLAWWDEMMDPSEPTAIADGRMAAWRAVHAGGLQVAFGPDADRVSTQVLRVCPACISTGYHAVVHQLEGLLYCPIHDEPLCTACPRCKEPLGTYTLQSQGGFTCSHCGGSLLGDRDLPIPSADSWVNKKRVFAPLVAWVKRTLPQIQLPLSCRHALFGRWDGDRLLMITSRVAQLALQAQIEPCPLEPRYIDPGVPELRVCASGRQSKTAPLAVRDAEALVTSQVARVSRWLRREVLREHYDCFVEGAHSVWAGPKQLAFCPQFCRRAYAFALWEARANGLLKWIREISRYWNGVVAIEASELHAHLKSAFHFGLNGIELACEMGAAGYQSLCDAVVESGCLSLDYSPWLELTEGSGHVWYLVRYDVTFTRRVAGQESFCDHGQVLRAYTAARDRDIEGLLCDTRQSAALMDRR